MHPNSLSIFFYWLFKVGFLLIDLLFVGFGILLIRQVKLMSETVIDPLNTKLAIISWLYLFLMLIIFGYFLLFF